MAVDFFVFGCDACTVADPEEYAEKSAFFVLIQELKVLLQHCELFGTLLRCLPSQDKVICLSGAKFFAGHELSHDFVSLSVWVPNHKSVECVLLVAFV